MTLRYYHTGPNYTMFQTWFDVQGAPVNVDVHLLGGRGAELVQDGVDGLCHIVRYCLGEPHLAVDNHAALPEV